jgi:hypothetical protein
VSDLAKALVLAVVSWMSGCMVGDRFVHDAFLTPAPSPQPQPTPWLWVDPAPDGGAMYVCYAPCTISLPFQKPSPAP